MVCLPKYNNSRAFIFRNKSCTNSSPNNMLKNVGVIYQLIVFREQTYNLRR